MREFFNGILNGIFTSTGAVQICGISCPGGDFWSPCASLSDFIWFGQLLWSWLCLRPGGIKRWCCLTSVAYIRSAGGVCGGPAGWRVLAHRVRLGRPGSRLPLRASDAGLGGDISWQPPAFSLFFLQASCVYLKVSCAVDAAVAKVFIPINRRLISPVCVEILLWFKHCLYVHLIYLAYTFWY